MPKCLGFGASRYKGVLCTHTCCTASGKLVYQELAEFEFTAVTEEIYSLGSHRFHD